VVSGFVDNTELHLDLFITDYLNVPQRALIIEGIQSDVLYQLGQQTSFENTTFGIDQHAAPRGLNWIAEFPPTSLKDNVIVRIMEFQVDRPVLSNPGKPSLLTVG